ncbi:hypothetical protein PIIN_08893 [Serendipita indica DSM 11827]|uniref:Uncharacterized protein n=1 Tax=Serendipita indica (strain DSM 11827) TaxID=1109443 RepID=G4TUD0_SERID|nr:hypothetical protein PIIN_08893 [Serendipita indica DSM 11827]
MKLQVGFDKSSRQSLATTQNVSATTAGRGENPSLPPVNAYFWAQHVKSPISIVSQPILVTLRPQEGQSGLVVVPSSNPSLLEQLGSGRNIGLYIVSQSLWKVKDPTDPIQVREGSLLLCDPRIIHYMPRDLSQLLANLRLNPRAFAPGPAWTTPSEIPPDLEITSVYESSHFRRKIPPYQSLEISPTGSMMDLD